MASKSQASSRNRFSWRSLISRLSIPKLKLSNPFAFIRVVPKRIRIIVATIIMTVLLTISSFFTFTTSWFIFIPVIIVVSYITTYLAIYEGVDKIEWYTLFVMPILLSISLYLFYSLLPVRWLTRLPFIVLFSFGYYAMLLTSNIFNVGVEKSIQLYRAAFSINYLTQTFIVFLCVVVSLSFRFNFILNAAIAGLVALIASVQLFWSVKLEHRFDQRIFILGIGVALLIFEVALLLSFMPLRINVVALTITALYYSITGIIYNYLGDRLFKNVIREYAFVTIFVIFIAVLTIQW